MINDLRDRVLEYGLLGAGRTVVARLDQESGQSLAYDFFRFVSGLHAPAACFIRQVDTNKG